MTYIYLNIIHRYYIHNIYYIDIVCFTYIKYQSFLLYTISQVYIIIILVLLFYYFIYHIMIYFYVYCYSSRAFGKLWLFGFCIVVVVYGDVGVGMRKCA